MRQLNILSLDAKDSIMTLKGPFSTNKTKDYTSLTGFISLTRKNDFWHSSLVPHLEELQKADELSFVKEARQNEIKNQEDEKKNLATLEEKKNKELAIAKRQEEEALKKQQQQQMEIAKTEESKRNDELKKQTLLAKQEEKNIKKEQKLQAQKDKDIAKQVLENEKKERAKAIAMEQEEKRLAKLEVKKQEPVLVRNTDPAAEVSMRKTVVQQTVYFSGDSLNLSLYDNGEIDGDTVSVLMNGKIILARQGLSASAIKKTIYITPGTQEIELVMFAETLGSIPPNTGLLIVRDGKAVYELRFSGDYKQNASILFKRKTPE